MAVDRLIDAKRLETSSGHGQGLGGFCSRFSGFVVSGLLGVFAALVCVCAGGLSAIAGEDAIDFGSLERGGPKLRADRGGVVFVLNTARSDGFLLRGGLSERSRRNADLFSQLDNGAAGARRQGTRENSREDISGPTVSDLALRKKGGARVAGLCAPRGRVQIELDGRMHREVVCDRDGRFVAEIGNVLDAGDHVLAAFERSHSGVLRSGQDIRVFIPEGYAAKGDARKDVVPLNNWRQSNIDLGKGDERAGRREGVGVSPEVRDYAQELARAASERFSQLTEPGGGTLTLPDVGDQPATAVEGFDDSAQVSGEEPSGDLEPTDSMRQVLHDRATRLVKGVQDWRKSSREGYFGQVVDKLKAGSGSAGDDARVRERAQGDIPLPERSLPGPGFERVDINIGTYFAMGRDWLEKASKDYQQHVVGPLSVPDGQPGDDDVGRQVAGVERNGAAKRESEASVPQRQSVVSSPGGRLANAARVAESESKSRQEALRLERDRPVLKPSSDEKDRGEDAAVREKKRLADLRAAAQRDESEQRERIARDKQTEALRKEQERRVALADAESKALTEAEADRERQRVLERERAAVERRKVERQARAKLRVPLPPKKARVASTRSREPASSRVKTPARNPKISAVTAVEVDPPVRGPARRKLGRVREGRSGLGAGKVASTVRKRKTRSASLRRAKASKKRRRSAVRSYRKRSKKKKRRGRRRRRAKTYVVRRGDTLWAIARRHYGSGHRYKLIARANRKKIRNPDLIRPRQRLRLPKARR